MIKWMMIFFVLITVVTLPQAKAEDKLSTEELIQNLQDPDPKTRIKAAKELGDRSEKLGVEALVKATSDADIKVQLEAVRALGKITDPQQVSSLSQAARNSKGEAQKEAMKLIVEQYIPTRDRNAFVELWATVGKIFNPPHPTIVEPWINVDAEAIEAVVFVMDQKTSDNRIDAAATLGILRAESALPRLKYYLRSPNQKMVRTCIRSIGYIRDREAGADLIPLLKHLDQEIVMDAARVLGQFRYQPALAELTRLFQQSEDKEYRRVIFQAISRIGDPSSEELMRAHLEDEDKDIRQYAIESIGRMGLQNYEQTLQLQFQRADNQQIKAALAYSLFALGETAYIDTLVRAADDSARKNQVREYLYELGPKAVPAVAAYLKPADKNFRLELIRILGDMRHPSAISYLEPYMKDADIEIAQEATDAIRELKKIESIPAS